MTLVDSQPARVISSQRLLLINRTQNPGAARRSHNPPIRVLSRAQFLFIWRIKFEIAFPAAGSG
ncbi:hypothetical protein KCP73_16620 [Salmonella enterica subsp. enterica]|nr:hypothetical protein KCP73_16620 [Salmonella enterica subsp. enterica]